MRTIFASLARANERVHLHDEMNFPQAKLDSEINARFVLTGMVTYIIYCLIIAYMLSSLKHISEGKKIQVKECTRPLLWDANYDRNYRNPLRPRRFKLFDFSTHFI